MPVEFDDFPTQPGTGPSLTLGTLLNQKFNALKNAINARFEGPALILTSPNGTRYKIQVADDGTLTRTAI